METHMPKYINRFIQPPTTSFFLFGPRGTGKSMWTAFSFPDAVRYNFLDADTYRRISARPERLKEDIHALKDGSTIVLDEIQKVPDVLDIIHALIEEKREWRFVMTGASSRKLKRVGVDLLAGRALLKTMHPFMASELPSQFALDKALIQGMLPLVYDSKNTQDTLSAYISLYIREEVQMEGIVRNMGNFNRFLEAVSFSHASVLNISNIARDCEVERRVVQNYIQVLDDLLLSFRVPIFSKRAKRELIKHEKFYLFDAGVFRCLRPIGPLDRAEEAGGAALEGLVAQHLRAWLAYRESGSLYYWRTSKGNEVDFILYGADLFTAIEVKNTAVLRPADFHGLQAFKEDYPECSVLLLYRGHRRYMHGSILCIPCDQFLQDLHPNRSMSEII